MEELTGDSAPDALALKHADVLVCTPEKWDGVSRMWKRREFVQVRGRCVCCCPPPSPSPPPVYTPLTSGCWRLDLQRIGLVIIDEIHLLGEDRGPILEVIVSRMRFIASQLGTHIRLMGLSTALANAGDLADWLGIDRVGLYNFRPSVRPIPMEVHIQVRRGAVCPLRTLELCVCVLQGFPGKHYCPRMATMNKPVYSAILTHSPEKPALVFVASRRQVHVGHPPPPVNTSVSLRSCARRPASLPSSSFPCAPSTSDPLSSCTWTRRTSPRWCRT